MRDKLIKLTKRAQNEWLEKEYEHETHKDLAEYVADYLLENGVIVPPCKVGQTVYKIFGEKVVEMRAVAIPLLISSCGAHLSVSAENGRAACISLDIDDFGKTVFLTREEAEKALERSENGK